jgi:hypothetical protein
MTYKRNQVDEAVSRLCPGSVPRMKRLLDVARQRGSVVFGYTAVRVGTGHEAMFSLREAHNLLLGARMMEHGFPQQTAVELLEKMEPTGGSSHETLGVSTTFETAVSWNALHRELENAVPIKRGRKRGGG